jgi:hypothetical protein
MTLEEVFMKHKLILAVMINCFIFVFILQSNAVALDDTPSMRCAGGIVAPGDSEDDVREKCGEPQKVLRPDPQEPAVWVYNFGSTQFAYYVSIVNGQVERIQTGAYGGD